MNRSYETNDPKATAFHHHQPSHEPKDYQLMNQHGGGALGPDESQEGAVYAASPGSQASVLSPAGFNHSPALPDNEPGREECGP